MKTFAELVGVAYPWARHRKIALKTARLLGSLRLYGPSLAVLTHLERRNVSDIDVVTALARTHARLGNTDKAAEYRAKLLRGRATRAAAAKGKTRPVQNLLRALAGLEALDKAAPLAATRRLNTLMSTDAGLAWLAAASEPVAAEFPKSILLLYCRAASLAKTDALDEASALVNRARAAIVLESVEATDADKTVRRRAAARLKQVDEIWRVVDGVARDNMSWGAIEATDTEAGPSDAGDGEQRVAEQSKTFDEALLQGRRQGDYLMSCQQRFHQAPTTREKLIAIKAMLRQGLRRMPTYHEAYEIARASFHLLDPDWRRLLVADGQTASDQHLGRDGGLKSVRLLVQVLQLARELELDVEVAEIEQSLLAYAHMPRARTMLWTICSVLVDGDPDRFTPVTSKLIDAPGAPPKAPHEIRDLLAWAARARRHDVAHALYAKLPEKARRSYPLIHYAKILQRDAQFSEAQKLVDVLNANVLAQSDFSPLRTWNLIRRSGELQFLVDSAKWFGKAPQPTAPKGVVFVMPRNAGQLRKYPMVVLMELKRQGWAVIPLVEGVLPVEPTGDPDLDRFNGCMLQDNRMSPAVEASFGPVPKFKVDVSRGELRWNDMDLSHPLFEEAAINRRRFSVDFTCPSLGAFLTRLVDWTQLNARVLENARRVMARKRLRTGIMVLNQYRLPDAVNRFYCEQKGDPRDFFCIHTANGYENYFANFSRPVSTKAVIRNMTAHPELRTASFPVPQQFEAWYDARKSAGSEMLERVRDITKVKRSTGTSTTRSPEALAAMERILAWRADGGKVACAFGKVVCDLGVPHDGGPAHKSLKDWLNHTIGSVRGSNTLLVIKPHPHELRNEIGTFLTEYLTDLIEVELPDNVLIMGHDWFDIHDLHGLIDLGLLYNGTTAVELGLLAIPAVLCSDYAPIDYPIGHAVPKSRAQYRKLVRFETPAVVASDFDQRAAGWIHYLSGDILTIPYRYHTRQITNKVVFPPRWFDTDIRDYLSRGDSNVTRLAQRILKAPARVRRPVAEAIVKTVAKAKPKVAKARPPRHRAA